MKIQWKFLIGVGIFAVFMLGSVFVYGLLSKSMGRQNLLAVASSSATLPPVSNNSGTGAASSQDSRTMAPDFMVLDAEGNEVMLSDLFGKPIVLNFWASWCPPCKSEMPDFETVYQDMGSDVQFVMVDLVGGRETLESGKAHIAEEGYTFPVFYDTQQQAANAYGVTSIPTSIFIDAEGYIVTGAQGAIDEETLRYGISLISG